MRPQQSRNGPLVLAMKKLIRNSTTELLIFTALAGNDSIEVRGESETVWLTQKPIGELFGVNVRTSSEGF